jgi:2,4-dienoyl-CoA reductase-like NADH-dependent reductase (Old Yellow Enzyme family)
MKEGLKMPKIFEPIKIGRMEVKNRIVAAPTVVAMADEGGYVTPRLKDVYEERAKGGAGLIVVEASWVRQDGRMFSPMLNISHDYARVGLSELVEVIHQNGARAAIQIMHGGRQTLASGMRPWPLQA